ncbi:MAG: hypothetical protein H7067_12305 [Burkholderiales bacterium]|nr:hypothetical protein [Opitutaceae bacterium]
MRAAQLHLACALSVALLSTTGCGAAEPRSGEPAANDPTLTVKPDNSSPSSDATATPPAADTPPATDPLAYKIHALPAGSIALFEGWQIAPIPSPDAEAFRTFPAGKENDFQMIVALATPGTTGMANLYQDGPAFVRGLVPVARRVGEPRDVTFGGDPARLEDYAADVQGKKLEVRLIMVKKKDVAVVVLGIGVTEAFAVYGRAVEIMAQGVTFTEAPTDPALTGTWSRNHSYVSGSFSFASQRSLTFYSNGGFSEATFAGGGGETDFGNTSGVSQGADRGRVVRRGSTLTFHYDNGEARTSDYRIVDGRALKLGGETYFKQ